MDEPQTIEGLLAKEPAPDELQSAFDCGSWAAIRALVTVLRRNGTLDQIAFADVCEEMLKIQKEHTDHGETARAEAVQLAVQDIALIASPAD